MYIAGAAVVVAVALATGFAFDGLHNLKEAWGVVGGVERPRGRVGLRGQRLPPNQDKKAIGRAYDPDGSYSYPVDEATPARVTHPGRSRANP